MTGELLRAPQGCFQSLKLTSSLRDCGHRAAIQKQKECSCKICTMCKFLRRFSPVSGCLSKLNVLTSRPHILLLFTFSLGAVAPQFKSKKNAPVKFALCANFYVALVQCRAVRQTSTVCRHELTHLCFFLLI